MIFQSIKNFHFDNAYKSRQHDFLSVLKHYSTISHTSYPDT